jgi:hypothetical protein
VISTETNSPVEGSNSSVNEQTVDTSAVLVSASEESRETDTPRLELGSEDGPQVQENIPVTPRSSTVASSSPPRSNHNQQQQDKDDDDNNNDNNDEDDDDDDVDNDEVSWTPGSPEHTTMHTPVHLRSSTTLSEDRNEIASTHPDLSFPSNVGISNLDQRDGNKSPVENTNDFT